MRATSFALEEHCPPNRSNAAMNKPHLHRRPCRFERLESKQVLAGDVTAFIAGGSLFLNGDDAANQVAITSDPVAGTITIDALDGEILRDRAGADIGGGAGGMVTLDGFRASVLIRMGDGDDIVGLNDITVPRTVRADMGAGDDNLGIGNLPDADPGDVSAEIGGSVVVIDRFGNNNLTLGDATVAGNAYFVTGGGDDDLNLGLFDPTVPGDTDTTLDVGGFIFARLGNGENDVLGGAVDARDVRFLGGSGDDALVIEDFDIRSLFFNGAGGNDDLAATGVRVTGNVLIRGGAGTDEFAITDTTARTARITGDAGDDDFALTNVDVALSLILTGGVGQEGIGLDDTNARTLLVIAGSDAVGDTVLIRNTADPGNRLLRLITGRGADDVDIVDSAFAALVSVRLGAGDDDLNLDTVTSARGLFDGGPAFDTLTEVTNMIGLDRTIRFEA